MMDVPDQTKLNPILLDLANIGIATVKDGLTSSRERILDLINRESLTADERADLLFEVDILLSAMPYRKGEL